MINVKPTDAVIEERHIVLECTESPFIGVRFYYEGMQFGEENNDGTCDMKFDYTLVDGQVPDTLVKEFEQYIGDALLSLLEDTIASHTTIFKGGVDDGTPMVE